MTTYQNIPAENLPFLYINNLIATNNATTPNTKVDLSAGQCRDSNDNMDINLTAAVTINTAVVGVNGLDTGTLAASKVYAVYVIADSTNKHQPAGIMTLASNSAPNMPFGYDSYRLVDYAVTDAAVHFLLMYKSGNNNARLFTYDAPQLALNAGNQAAYTGVALTTLVAPVANTPVHIYSDFNANAAADILKYQGYNSTGDAVTVIAPVAGATAHTTATNVVLAQLNSAAPSIKYKVSAGAVTAYVAAFEFYV